MSIPENKDQVKLHSRWTKGNAKRNHFQSKYIYNQSEVAVAILRCDCTLVVQKVKVKMKVNEPLLILRKITLSEILRFSVFINYDRTIEVSN